VLESKLFTEKLWDFHNFSCNTRTDLVEEKVIAIAPMVQARWQYLTGPIDTGTLQL
jgi:hypothetical protein